MNIVPQPAALSRRSFLRGVGVTLALPLLEAMQPAFSRAAAPAAPRRMLAIQTDQGIMPHLFFPEKAGRDYELPRYLKTLEDFRSEFTVFSGLSHPGVDGGHANELCFLTGAPHPAGAAFRNSISVDQLAAEQIGNDTHYPSLVIAAGTSNTSMSFNRAGTLLPLLPLCGGFT